MSDYLENSRRDKEVDVKDIMILKGLMLGKTLREIQADLLAKSHNTVTVRIEALIEGGYLKKHEYYSRTWELTDKGREEVRKYIS